MVNDDTENRLLLRSLKHLLKPLIRFLINKQITLATLVEVIKSAYVEVAESDFAVEGKSPTDSRINLLTGVHRKDVKRLRDQDDAFEPSDRLSINSLMLATWQAEAPYCKKGVPVPLPMTGPVSFESLANLYTRQNIRASSILENWKNLSWIIENEKGLWELNLDALQANQLTEDQLYFFSENLADHLAASTHNLVNDKKHFERAVFYNHLSPDSIDVLRRSAKTQAMDVLRSLNKEALALQKQDRQHEQAHYRFRLGSYFYTDMDEKQK